MNVLYHSLPLAVEMCTGHWEQVRIICRLSLSLEAIFPQPKALSSALICTIYRDNLKNVSCGWRSR